MFLYQLIGKLLLGFLELFRKTIFISATVLPPEGTAEKWRSRSFYLLQLCVDSIVKVLVVEEPED